MSVAHQVKFLTQSPGVYIYKDSSGQIIYVGKAVNIQKRVSSYFRPQGRNLKTSVLVEHIATIETISTFSEAEALILEANLIKTHQPKYNIQLKDGKSYPYIQITQEEYPLVSIVRLNMRKDKNIPAHLYGPYINPPLIREALIIIRKIFPFRSCDPLLPKVCLDYHMRLCQGPCEGHISKEHYARNIRHVRYILEGRKDDLLKELHAAMDRAAMSKAFEEAAIIRDQIRAIGALYSGTKDINYFKEAEQLMRVLNLSKPPVRIECFDNSNTMGKEAVGAMVSFLNGQPDKSNYRRFKIKTVDQIDDFAMMKEIVYRRYRRLKAEGRLMPDLIVIDGGKGQLSAAQEALKALELHIPIMGLAKREEEIFLPQKRNSIKLKHDSLGLKLLQRVRDEAHRFGLAYHRLLRQKKFVPGAK